MKLLTLFTALVNALAMPLSPLSTITIRSTMPSSIYNSPIIYRPLILEEWSLNNQLLQSWYPTCTLPGIQTENYNEGLLRPRYPYMDGVWFLCRDVPANSSFSYSPAAVVIMNIGEDGNMYQYSADNTTYAIGTTTNQVLAFFNETLNANIFYLMGGGAPASTSGIARPLQPRIRVDYLPRAPPPPPNLAGPLVSLPTTTTPWGLAIMTDSLFMPANFLNGTILTPVVYGVGTENSLPSVARATFAPSLFTPSPAPVILSFCTYPLLDLMWYTFFNRVASLARANFTDPDVSTRIRSWPLPTTTTGGTLGGSSWRVTSVAFSLDGTESIYITNGTMIMTNTLGGLTQGQPFTLVLQSPPEWKYLDAYVRTQGQAPPNAPSPSARASVTPTRTVSRTATQSVSPTLTQSTTPTRSQTATQTASPSITSSPSASSSSSPSPSVTSSMTVTQTATLSITSSITATSSTTPTSFRSPSFSPSVFETVTPTSSMTSSMTATNTASPSISQTITASVSPSQDIIPPAPIPVPRPSGGLSVGAGAGVGVAVVAVVGAIGLVSLTRTAKFRSFYISKFGMKSTPKAPRVYKSSLKTNTQNFEINQNPYLVSQARVVQLRQMQDEMKIPSSRDFRVERMKKEFRPNMTNQAVKIIGKHGKDFKGISV